MAEKFTACYSTRKTAYAVRWCVKDKEHQIISINVSISFILNPCGSATKDIPSEPHSDYPHNRSIYLIEMNEPRKKNGTSLTYFVPLSFIKSLPTIFVSLWFFFTYSIDTHQNHSIHIWMKVDCHSLTHACVYTVHRYSSTTEQSTAAIIERYIIWLGTISIIFLSSYKQFSTPNNMNYGRYIDQF